MNMFIVKKDMCTKCRKHIALTYSTKKKHLINIAFELVVRFHAQAIRPRSEDDNVGHGIGLFGLEPREDPAAPRDERLDELGARRAAAPLEGVPEEGLRGVLAAHAALPRRIERVKHAVAHEHVAAGEGGLFEDHDARGSGLARRDRRRKARGPAADDKDVRGIRPGRRSSRKPPRRSFLRLSRNRPRKLFPLRRSLILI